VTILVQHVEVDVAALAADGIERLYGKGDQPERKRATPARAWW
jgi:hypothetical protein